MLAPSPAPIIEVLHEVRLVEIGPAEQVLGSPWEAPTQRFLRRLLEAGRL